MVRSAPGEDVDGAERFITHAVAEAPDAWAASPLEAELGWRQIRRGIGSRLKQMTVNQDQWCHGKGREAVTLRPQWRILMSLNDEAENLMVLPPMDDSIEDKSRLMRVRRPKLFDDASQWSNIRASDWGKIRAGLPGLMAFLHQFEIPAAMRSGRFGVKAHHDPDIMVALHNVSPEARLLELIDASDLFVTAGTKVNGGGEFKHELRDFIDMWSFQLEQHLTSEPRDRNLRESAGRLLTFNSATGSYLARLAKKGGRGESRTVRGDTIWRIHRRKDLN